MLNKLLEYGINQNTIEILENNDSLCDDLYLNIDNCINIIKYLKSIGLRFIDEILLYKTDLFMDDVDNIKKLFDKKENIIKEINNDTSNIDLLFEN